MISFYQEGIITKVDLGECPIGIEKIANQLVDKITGVKLPSDYIPGDQYYNEILANSRHEYTNYEELLWEMDELANCIQYYQNGNVCPLEEDGLECFPRILAHDTLKWAAKEEAEYLYQQWLESKK